MSTGKPASTPRLIHVVSLGCAKNRVDSEEMVARFQTGGWELCQDPAQADAILVNTCAFIRSATQESIDTILELARWKTEGRCGRLVVAGCLPERYRESLSQELPEVDCFLGVPERRRILEVLDAPGADLPRDLTGSGFPEDDASVVFRSPSDLPHSAWLKISEGCDHRCAFCVIPSIRGPYRSRPASTLIAEAEHLVAQGVRELNLVAQDTMAWGRDLEARGSANLATLVESLCGVQELRWVRVLYAFPYFPPDKLLELMNSGGKLCRYLDIPLQHASDHMLRAMRRGLDRAAQERLLAHLRASVPGLTLRTTFIVGFPGETEEDFEELLEFVKTWRFDRIGVFRYSREDGSEAAGMPDQVPARVRDRRYRQLINLVARLGLEAQRAKVGSVLQVLVDGPSEQAPFIWEGRTEGQAPEVDGKVFITVPPELIDLHGPPRAGELIPVRILDATEVDLSGERVEMESGSLPLR